MIPVVVWVGMRIKHGLVTFSLFCLALTFYLIPIYKNTVSFFTDEMYWISTANTVYRLLEGDTKNPLWRENYGFTNFNGAKYIYGVGLLLFGHRNVRIVGTAPQTYFQWIAYEPNPFPKDHTAFPLVFHARIISAITTALAISLLYPLGITIGLPIFSAILATILFLLHPIPHHVATHAFSDGILLFWQMVLLISLFWRRKSWHTYVIIGIVLGALVSVKINGLLFVPVIFFVVAYSLKKNTVFPYRRFLTSLAATGLSGVLVFLLVHPNLFFYPEYTFVSQIRDRMLITAEHIAYFSRVNPPHVILAPQARIASMVAHIFPVWLTAMTIISLFWFFKNGSYRKIPQNTAVFFISGAVVTLSVLSYCVFNEPRYYLPIIPFALLFIGYGIRRI